jgi:hypothetical protein
MRRRLAVLGVLALAGCAAPHYIYEKRSATPAQLDRDLEACKREGFRASRFAVWPSNRYDWDVVNRCMERKGYRVQRPEA